MKTILCIFLAAVLSFAVTVVQFRRLSAVRNMPLAKSEISAEQAGKIGEMRQQLAAHETKAFLSACKTLGVKVAKFPGGIQTTHVATQLETPFGSAAKLGQKFPLAKTASANYANGELVIFWNLPTL